MNPPPEPHNSNNNNNNNNHHHQQQHPPPPTTTQDDDAFLLLAPQLIWTRPPPPPSPLPPPPVSPTYPQFPQRRPPQGMGPVTLVDMLKRRGLLVGGTRRRPRRRCAGSRSATARGRCACTVTTTITSTSGWAGPSPSARCVRACVRACVPACVGGCGGESTRSRARARLSSLVLSSRPPIYPNHARTHAHTRPHIHPHTHPPTPTYRQAMTCSFGHTCTRLHRSPPCRHIHPVRVFLYINTLNIQGLCDAGTKKGPADRRLPPLMPLTCCSLCLLAPPPRLAHVCVVQGQHGYVPSPLTACQHGAACKFIREGMTALSCIYNHGESRPACWVCEILASCVREMGWAPAVRQRCLTMHPISTQTDAETGINTILPAHSRG